MNTRLSRPYARKRGGPPSVTTVIDSMNKAGLPWGAAKETAVYVVHHLDDVAALVGEHGPEYAADVLRRHHRGVWDGKADIGTLVHAVNEAWCAGEVAELDRIAAELKAAKSVKAADPLLLAAQAGPYVDGLERFWDDCQPETLATEYVVRHNGKGVEYVGTADWLAVLHGDAVPERLRGRPVLLDLKTTAEQDVQKGLYADSWRLQLAALRLADEVVLYDGEGNEVGTGPMPQVDWCGVVHMRGEGHYDLIELQAAGDEKGYFIRLRTIWEWMNKASKVPAAVYVCPPVEMSKEGAA